MDLADLLGRIVATTPPLSTPATLLCLLVGALLVLVPLPWRLCRHVVTIAHEGGHAVVATIVGRRLSGIRLHADTSGLTVSRGRPRGPGMVFTLLAGYPAAGTVGLAGSWMLSTGHAAGMLWALLVLLALLLVQVRNWFGLWSVLVSAVVLLIVTWFGDELARGAFAIVVVSVLIVGSIRTVLELQVSRSRRRLSTSDADQLARITHLPGIVWVGVMLIVCVGCAAASAWLLVLPIA